MTIEGGEISGRVEENELIEMIEQFPEYQNSRPPSKTIY